MASWSLTIFPSTAHQGCAPHAKDWAVIQEFDLEQIIDPDFRIAEDCCSIASSYQTVRYGNIYDNLARLYEFSVKTPWKKLSEKAKKVFLYGTEKKWTRMRLCPSRQKEPLDRICAMARRPL